ncbi:hypothetical protein TNCV_869031 [Trichonephila clavipes]|nr:hypothetical protein TNCV_869031 [Trichonephila clavipes]
MLKRNRLTCWTKPSNCDANLSLLDARGNDGTNRAQFVTPLPMMTGGCAHESDGSSSRITNHISRDSKKICYTSFCVHMSIRHRLPQS